MVLYKDRRLFKRYNQKTDFYIIIDGVYYNTATVDFSLSGLCIFIEGKPQLSLGSPLDFRIEDLDMEIKGYIVWIKSTENNLLVGIEKMTISGFLKICPVSDILLDLQRSDITGILEISDGSVVKKIFLKDGIMVFSLSNQQQDHLGEVLVRMGRITSDQYYQAVNLLKTSGRRLGSILVELKYLKPEELVRSLKLQVEEIILSLFTWENGTVKFTQASLPGDIMIIKLSAANLIFQGIKRINKPEFFKNVSPSPETIMYFSNEPMNLFQDITLTEEDRYILSILDSKLTFKDLCDISSLGEFKTMKILCALSSIRMIEKKGERVLDDQTIIRIIREPRRDIDSDFIERVEELYRRYQHMDYYSILGIERNASDEQIRKAYYLLAKEYHPDRHFQSGSESLKSELNEIFSYISEGYKTLSDRKLKTDYDANLKTLMNEAGLKSETQTAKNRFLQGREALKKGDYALAAELFGQAAYIDRATADYHYYLAIASRKLKRHHDARNAISKALETDSSNPDYLAESGNIFFELGFYRRAKSDYEKALKIKPDNKKALEGMKMIRKVAMSKKVEWL